MNLFGKRLQTLAENANLETRCRRPPPKSQGPSEVSGTQQTPCFTWKCRISMPNFYKKKPGKKHNNVTANIIFLDPARLGTCYIIFVHFAVNL